MAQGKWWHQLLKLSSVMARDAVQVKRKVLAGQVAEALKCYEDVSDYKDYQLLFKFLEDVQKEMRNRSL